MRLIDADALRLELAEGMKCMFCENPIRTNRGCDGNCIIQNKQLMQAVENGVADTIKRQTTIEAEPVRHGEWEFFVETSFNGEVTEVNDCGWRCSCCKKPLEEVVGGYWDDDTSTPTLKYCPNCGAKMDEVGE